MVFLRSFCFRFTVRLGSLIVGVFSCVESAVAVFLLSWFSPEFIRSRLCYIVDNYSLSYLNDVFSFTLKHTDYFSRILLGFFCLHCVLSLLLVYSSYYCLRRFLVSWLVCEAVRIGLLLVAFVIVLLAIKENDSDLGLLIPATLSSSFLLMYLLYCWTCPLSLYQALSRVSRVSPPVRQVLPTVAVDSQTNDIYDFYPSLRRVYD